MIEAFLQRDASYDGVFYTGVRTTGIFCRPICSARKPLTKNLSFFAAAEEALSAGYRPCLRCRPLEQGGEAPRWLRPLLAAVEADPARRWTDQDMRERGLSPSRVRRWFKKTHGMTFHAYSRARRLGAALGRVQDGEGVSRAAFEVGYDSLSGFQEAFRRYFGDAPTVVSGARVAHVARLATPLGPMLAATTDDRVHLVEFIDRRGLQAQIRRVGRRSRLVFTPGSTRLTDALEAQLGEYFEGTRRSFDLPLAPAGSDFQASVWEALLAIPYGETRSYADIAKSVGRPAAVRAVGSANGANALAVIIPCHRVVRADGSLSGYGGGVWRKRRLLELEQATLEGQSPAEH
ncbi:MAG: bifunctional transcriptional activator/DNA repair protein Ada [Gemmatimonadetes bacterium]|nr:bifunctional transcriptional activator/DNA repair protein Ada [Gemmatimonadota bacterium]